jgi:hypothetical protein
MDQDTQPAPFNLGDHVCYVATEQRYVPAVGHQALVLTTGMVGTIMLSTGSFPGHGAESPHPWHCRVQFRNGYQADITPEKAAYFEPAPHAGR